MKAENSSEEKNILPVFHQYRVSWIERHVVSASVTAVSAEEAIEKAMNEDHDDDMDIDVYGPADPSSYVAELIDEE